MQRGSQRSAVALSGGGAGGASGAGGGARNGRGGPVSSQRSKFSAANSSQLNDEYMQEMHDELARRDGEPLAPYDSAAAGPRFGGSSESGAGAMPTGGTSIAGSLKPSWYSGPANPEGTLFKAAESNVSFVLACRAELKLFSPVHGSSPVTHTVTNFLRW